MLELIKSYRWNTQPTTSTSTSSVTSDMDMDIDDDEEMERSSSSVAGLINLGNTCRFLYDKLSCCGDRCHVMSSYSLLRCMCSCHIIPCHAM